MPYLVSTALGPCRISWSERGLTRIELLELTSREERAQKAAQSEPPPHVRQAADALVQHLEGKGKGLRALELDLSGLPPFRRAVLEALRDIPAGRTATYGELAKKLGRPGGARAVGQAVGKNPLLVAVPCHRVLAAAGNPGGFSAPGGLATKARLLALEGVQLEPSLFAGASPGALPFDADEALRHLSKADAKLGRAISQVGPLRLRLSTMQSPFQALAESIVYQQLTGKAAATILGRVVALFHPRRFPRPADLLAADPQKLRGAGLSGAKTAALKDLAAKALEGKVPTLSQLADLSNDEIIGRLTEVRGIGRWTVEMLLIFRLGRPDVLPATDYGVRKGFAKLMNDDELPAPKDLLAYGERWAPYRTVASWYLWRVLELP